MPGKRTAEQLPSVFRAGGVKSKIERLYSGKSQIPVAVISKIQIQTGGSVTTQRHIAFHIDLLHGTERNVPAGIIGAHLNQIASGILQSQGYTVPHRFPRLKRIVQVAGGSRIPDFIPGDADILLRRFPT